MKIKMITWIYIPILISLFIMIGALLSLFKRNSANDLFLFLLLSIFNGYALYILIVMLIGAYPSAFAYIIIAISVITLALRKLLMMINKKKIIKKE